jgi:hypothetical protein
MRIVRIVADPGQLPGPDPGRGEHRDDRGVAPLGEEVLRLAGANEEARDCLRRALDIYTERRAVPLAERTRSALASLRVQPG